MGSKIEEDDKRRKNINEGVLEEFFDNHSYEKKYITIPKLFQALEDNGLFPTRDQNMKDFMRYINTMDEKLSKEEFFTAASLSGGVIIKALSDRMETRNFERLRHDMKNLYDICDIEREGTVTKVKPSQQNRETWEVCMHEVSNRKTRFGKTNTSFLLRSCSRPLIFALTVDLLGIDEVRKHVGYDFYNGHVNDIAILNKKGIPCNALINGGGIILCSWLRNKGLKDLTRVELFDYIYEYLKDLAGGSHIKFNNAAFISARGGKTKNHAMIYYLRMKNCFPPKTNIEQDLDFYHLTCCFEVTVDSLSVIAATIANYGVSPVTEKQVLKFETCKHTMALLQYCSPTPSWLQEVGLPASSNVSGAILVIFPGVFGLSLFSPKVNKYRTSVKSEKFCMAFSKQYQIHPFYNISQRWNKTKPKKTVNSPKSCQWKCMLHYAAAGEHASTLASMCYPGLKFCDKNYMGKNLLHEAAAAGNMSCVMYLMNSCPHMLHNADIMGCTPLDDAKLLKRQKVIDYLMKWNTLKTGV